LLSIVCPVYCSATLLGDLYRRLSANLLMIGEEYEIILVEDCSWDNSWKIIEELVRDDPRVRGIRLLRNYGQHNALLCGIRAARGETIVTLDDDLQNPPEEIPKLLSKLAEGYDVVYGKPEVQTHGFLRNQASRITKLALQSIMGAETAGKVSAFRAFRTQLRDAFYEFRGPSVNIDVLLTWGASRFVAVHVRQEKRADGESGYTLFQLISHAVNMMTGFSILPLQLASIAGFFFSIVGFLMLLFVIGRYLTEGSAVQGFAFLASIISKLSGVQLFALGIFGEYLARMHFRSMERPTYCIKEQIGTF
jgi:glycosyltransferase involved in cell wall biosynthesis